MRHFLFGLAALLVATSAAHADPLAVHATTDAAPSTYLATGVSLGGVGTHTASGVTGDISEHVWKALWIHAGGTMVDDGQLFGGKGSYDAAYAGVELSSCKSGDRICAYVGGDVGYAHSQYTESSWDGGDGMSTDVAGAIGVMRAGLDIGGTHLRWRPGVQATIAGPSAGAITQSVAYRF